MNMREASFAMQEYQEEKRLVVGINEERDKRENKRVKTRGTKIKETC